MGTRRVAGFGAVLTTLLLLLYVGSVGALATTAGTTVLSSEDSQNVCSPSPTGKPIIIPATLTTPKTITCTIAQPQPATSGHTNKAVCIEHSSTPVVKEVCMVTQTNSDGTNWAVVAQDITQTNSRTQDGTQRSTVLQTNSIGRNVVGIDQQINQSTTVSGNQSQRSDQGFRHMAPFEPGATIQQQNGTGANLIVLNQVATQKEKTGSKTATQHQTAGENGSINQLHTPLARDRPIPSSSRTRT